MDVLTTNPDSLRISQTIRYINERQMGFNPHSSVQLMRSKLNNARNLFRKDLYSHYGCVNAIEFSNEGDWLVSGGDDRRVLLWNVERAIHGSEKPASMKGEHSSNIFCLSFDNENSKIFSAGNDEQVIVHDTRTGETLDVFNHEEAVYGISVDPLNSNVYASACDDGRVLIWDIREPPSNDPFCLASYSSAFHAVMYNPMEPRLLATANSKEGVSLWDVRHPKSLLMKYGGSVPVQSCMSVRFNRNGTQILALRRRLPPILFDVHSTTDVCQFDQIGYYNSCTMKSCCFAGDNDQFVCSGSDDFNLYIWKIPEEGNGSQNWVETAHMALRGHRSIVNQVRFNPSNCLLASSGVEKIVKFWSPFAIPSSSGGLSRSAFSLDKRRKVYSHLEYINMVMHSGQVMTHDYSHKSTKEDSRMMAFFDSLVQREIEGLASDSSLSSANSDSWLYNVAGTAILSDLASSSDGSSDDDGGNRPTDGGDGRSDQLSPLTVAYANAIASRTGWNFDPPDEESTTEAPDERRSSETNAAAEEVNSRGVGGDSDSQQSVTNTISWLIRQKRQQLLQSATEKRKRESESSERSSRRTSTERKSSSRATNSRMSPTTSTSEHLESSSSSSCSPVMSSSEATALEVSSNSSASSSSSSSSPTSLTLQSSPSSPSLDDEGTSERHLSNRGLHIELASNDGIDRRKVFRKRRTRILQDLSDSDSGMDDEASPRRKKFCTRSKRIEDLDVIETKLENETNVEEIPTATLADSVINSKRVTTSLSEEHGETSGSASTPDSGIIVPQDSESKKLSNETPEVTSTRFKRIRMRGNGGQRQYRSRSNRECN